MRIARGLLLVLAVASAARAETPYPDELRIERLSNERDLRYLRAAPGCPIILSVRVYADEYDRPPRRDVLVRFEVVSGTACAAASASGSRTDERGVTSAVVLLGEIPKDGPPSEEVVVRASLLDAPDRAVEFRLTNSRPDLRFAALDAAVRGEPLRDSPARVVVGDPILVCVDTMPEESARADADPTKADVVPDPRLLTDERGRAWFAVVPRAPGPLTAWFWVSLGNTVTEKRPVRMFAVEDKGPPASWRVQVEAGDLQYGAKRMSLGRPVVLRATGPDGAPLAGRRLAFESLVTGGTIEPAEVSTDADGRASVTYTCADSSDLDAVRVSVKGDEPGRPCVFLVQPAKVRFVEESPPGSGHFEHPRYLSDYDSWPGRDPSGGQGGSQRAEPIVYLELTSRDLGETATAELKALQDDGSPVPSSPSDLLPPRQEIPLTAVRREPGYTLYRSGPLVGVNRPETLNEEERGELARAGTLRGWRAYLLPMRGSVRSKGPLEAEKK